MKIVILACFLVATAFAEKPQRLRTRRAEEEHVWKKAMEALLDRGEKVEPIVWDALFLAQELEDASMSLPPTDAPSAAPTVTKDIATEQPSASPTGAPVEPPTAPPVEPPTAPPVVSPTDAPVIPPTAAPVTPPTSPPTDAPVPQPAPTDAPVGTTPVRTPHWNSKNSSVTHPRTGSFGCPLAVYGTTLCRSRSHPSQRRPLRLVDARRQRQLGPRRDQHDRDADDQRPTDLLLQ